MADKWAAKLEDADPYQNMRIADSRYWEIRSSDPEGDSYIVDYTYAGPDDVLRLVAMLNEREELLNKVAEYEKVFRHALNQAPSEAAIAGYTWAWKFDVLVQKIRQVFKG